MPFAVTSGVVVAGSLAAATASLKLLPPSTALSTLLTKSSIADLRLSAVSLAAISARAWASVLPPPALTESIFTTTQPKSEWTGPTTEPAGAANIAVAVLSPATPA